MKTYHIPRENGPDLNFAADRIAFATSQRPGVHYWTELALYETQAGALVAHTVGATDHPHKEPLHKARVCDSELDVFEFLGFGRLARALYETAGWDVPEAGVE